VGFWAGLNNIAGVERGKKERGLKGIHKVRKRQNESGWPRDLEEGGAGQGIVLSHGKRMWVEVGNGSRNTQRELKFVLGVGWTWARGGKNLPPGGGGRG